MSTTIHHRARFSGFGLYHLTVALLLGAFIGISLTVSLFVTSGAANADEGNTHTTVVASYGDTFTVVTRHNVVITSTLRHCPLEDGGPRLRKNGPCTWNIGTTDGNGLGWGYVLYLDHGQRRAHYVWAADPTIHGWVWLAEGGPDTDCVFKPYKAYVRCPDGNLPIDHP